jgi:hypothetical protein
MITVPRILVTAALLAALFTLGRVAGCSASRPYGTPGVALHTYITSVSE